MSSHHAFHIVALGSFLCAAGCASGPPAPLAEIALARTAVTQADQAGAALAAPAELTAARDRLALAEHLQSRDPYVARWRARESEADAHLAEATAKDLDLMARDAAAPINAALILPIAPGPTKPSAADNSLLDARAAVQAAAADPLVQRYEALDLTNAQRHLAGAEEAAEHDAQALWDHEAYLAIRIARLAQVRADVAAARQPLASR